MLWYQITLNVSSLMIVCFLMTQKIQRRPEMFIMCDGREHITRWTQRLENEFQSGETLFCQWLSLSMVLNKPGSVVHPQQLFSSVTLFQLSEPLFSRSQCVSYLSSWLSALWTPLQMRLSAVFGLYQPTMLSLTKEGMNQEEQEEALADFMTD